MSVAEGTEDWIRFALAPDVKHEEALRLLRAFGSPGAVLRSARSALRNVVSPLAADSIVEGAPAAAVERTLDWLSDQANSIVPLDSPSYPQSLLQITDAPIVLYAKGVTTLLNKPCIAIVGSRNSTAQGNANALAFARSLSDAGLTVVSGLALGIDAAAHEGALAGASSTIAVAGTGLDIVYPARNRELAHQIAQRGLLISEFPLGTSARDFHFPRRNRLISGLSRGVLVVEAAPRSGSLSTARLAGEQGREVFAIPGSIHSPLSRGCHALIKQGAKLVESAQDVLDELHWRTVAPRNAPKSRESVENAFLQSIGFDPIDVETLMTRTELSISEVTAKLAELQLDGAVAVLPGGKFQRIF